MGYWILHLFVTRMGSASSSSKQERKYSPPRTSLVALQDHNKSRTDQEATMLTDQGATIATDQGATMVPRSGLNPFGISHDNSVNHQDGGSASANPATIYTDPQFQFALDNDFNKDYRPGTQPEGIL